MFRAELKLAIYDAKYVLTIHELKSLRHQCASQQMVNICNVLTEFHSSPIMERP